MMGSSPVADNELYSLLKLISDPDGAKQRLDALSSQAAANAESYRQQVADIEEQTKVANELSAKAAADSTEATANLARANDLLAANQARHADLSAKADALRDTADDLTSREAALKATAAAQDAAFSEREAGITSKSDLLDAAVSKVVADQAAVTALKSQLEDKLAAIRKLAD